MELGIEPRKAPGPRESPGRVALQARAHTHTGARAQVGRPLPLPLTCCHEQDPCSQNDVPLGLVDAGGRHAHAPEQQQDGAEDGEDAGGPDDPWGETGEGRGGGVGWGKPGRQSRPPEPLARRASCVPCPPSLSLVLPFLPSARVLVLFVSLSLLFKISLFRDLMAPLSLFLRSFLSSSVFLLVYFFLPFNFSKHSPSPPPHPPRL